MTVILRVENLKTYFNTDSGLVKAVDGISYYINDCEIVGIVGESGCGKSVSQLSVMQLIPTPPGKIIEGKVLFEGLDLLKFKPTSNQMHSIRGAKISMIFQEPLTSLNPVFTIGDQLIGLIKFHLKMSEEVAKVRAKELLKLVGIPDAERRLHNYPHQFSGGMRQRVMIAMAISCNPRLVIADEPTTALDVTTQAQVLEVMMDIVKNFNTSVIIVTHNLGIVARHAQRIYVMYAGRIVESGTTEEILCNPLHPYTRGLINSVPRLDEKLGTKLVPIDGVPPNLIDMPRTCAFLPRCGNFEESCQREPWPDLRLIEGQHSISCHVDIKGK